MKQYIEIKILYYIFVQSNRRNVLIKHYLKYNVLYTVAKCWAKGIDFVGGWSSIQDYRLFTSLQVSIDFIPLAVGIDLNVIHINLELTSVISIEIIMTRIVCMQNKLFSLISACIKQYIKAKCKVVEEEVGFPLSWDQLVCVWTVNFHLILGFEEDLIGSP